MEELLTLLAAGGDAFTIGVCVLLYKIDKRLTRVEIIQQMRGQNVDIKKSTL